MKPLNANPPEARTILSTTPEPALAPTSRCTAGTKITSDPREVLPPVSKWLCKHGARYPLPANSTSSLPGHLLMRLASCLRACSWPLLSLVPLLGDPKGRWSRLLAVLSLTYLSRSNISSFDPAMVSSFYCSITISETTAYVQIGQDAASNGKVDVYNLRLSWVLRLELKGQVSLQSFPFPIHSDPQILSISRQNVGFTSIFLRIKRCGLGDSHTCKPYHP